MNKSQAPEQYQYALNSNSRSISTLRNSLRYWLIMALLALTTISVVSCLRVQNDDALSTTPTLTSQDATISVGGSENTTQTLEAAPAVTESNAQTPNSTPTAVKAPEDAAGYAARRQQSDELVEAAYQLLQNKSTGDEIVRLARDAVLTTLNADGYVTLNAHNVLQAALDTPAMLMTYPPATHRHQAQTTSIDISPDGNILVTGGDNTVRLWHSTTLEPLHLFRGHEGSVLSTQFSADGKEVLSAGTDHTIRLWNVETGIVTLLLNAHTDVVHAAHYSPDGKTIVSASDDGTAKVWDRVTGQELLTLPHSGPVLTAIYSPDGRMIASASAKQLINLWDAHTGQLIQSWSVNDEVHAIAFSPDNKHLLVGTIYGRLSVWETESFTQVQLLSTSGDIVTKIAFTTDGGRMLTVSDEAVVKVWDTQTWTTLLTIWEANHAVASAVFSPDGKRVISAGHIVQVRDSNTGKRLSIQPGHTADIWSVAYSPDGKRLLTTSSDYTIRVWDVMSGAELLVITPRAEISTPDGAGGINLITGQNDLESIIPAVYSPDGTQIANGGNYARVWDAETGAELFALNSQDDFVMSVAYSPDGKRLAVATGAKIRILQANNGEEILQMQDIDNLVIDVDFSPDGNFIASVDGSQTGSPAMIRIWDASTGIERFAVATSTYIADYIAFSPDSKRLIGQDGEQTKIWNVADGTELLAIGENVTSSEAHFSADGQHLATLTLFGGEVRLWQAHTGTELLRLPSERVFTLQFSPDSQSLAVAGYTIRTWPVKAAPSLPTLQEGEVADLSAVDTLLHAAQKRMQRP